MTIVCQQTNKNKVKKTNNKTIKNNKKYTKIYNTEFERKYLNKNTVFCFKNCKKITRYFDTCFPAGGQRVTKIKGMIFSGCGV